jgi:hypothetical protein
MSNFQNSKVPPTGGQARRRKPFGRTNGRWEGSSQGSPALVVRQHGDQTTEFER